jgi:homoserine dehydrogenase
VELPYLSARYKRIAPLSRNGADKSGVLASIATVFAKQGVSIQGVRQSGMGLDAELIVVTHAATEDDLDATVEALKAMDIVKNVESVIRVEGVGA